MSTMEHLFMQIFDRKEWIEDQLKHQIESYGQSLASNLLAEGRQPPPWLWTTGSDGSDWPDPEELNKEQLISEILNPLPWTIATSANRSTLFTLPALKGDNLFQSNSFFTKTCASSKYLEVKNRDEVVPKDVPEGSKQNSEMMLEPKVIEDYPELKQPARLQSSRSKHRDLEMPLSKKAKTTKHPVEKSFLDEFTGRVTRSVSVVTSLKPDYVKESLELKNLSVIHNGDDGKATRSSSAARKYHSADQSSKLAKPQKDFLPVPSASIDNLLLKNPPAKEVVPDAAYAAPNGCQITSSVSFTLSEINSLVEPKHLFDGIEDSVLNENPVVAFEKKNTESTSEVALVKWEAMNNLLCKDSNKAQDSFVSRQLDEDVLHASETIRRTEETDRVPLEDPVDERLVVEDSECDSHLTCHDCKPSGIPDPSSSKEATFENSENAPTSSFTVIDRMLNYTKDFSGSVSELQGVSRKNPLGSLVQCTLEEQCSVKIMEVSERDHNIFVGIDKCDMNENPVVASVKESQNRSEVTLIKLNAALKDGLVRGGSKSAHDSSTSRQLQEGDVSNTVKIVHKREEVDRASDGSPAEGLELPEEEDSECLSHPASYNKECRISENALTNSSPKKDCILNSVMDSSGHFFDRNDISRKNSLGSTDEGQCTDEEQCIGKPKEVLTDIAVSMQPEGSCWVESKHIPVDRIEVCVLNENFVADSEVVNRISDESQDKRSDIIGTEDLESGSHLPSCNSKPSLPSISSSKENATAYFSPVTECMWNSMKGLSGQPTVLQDNGEERLSESPLQYAVGEKCKGRLENETTVGSLKRTNSGHCDGSMLYFSETSEVFMGAEEADSFGKEVMQRSIARSTISPDVADSRYEMLEGARDIAEMGTVRDRITPNSREVHNAVPIARYLLRSSSSHDKHYASFKSSGISDSSNLKQSVETIDHAYDITWPKRRKMKGRSNNILATSPRLRVKAHRHIQERNDYMCRKSSKNASGSSIEFQPFMLSNEMEIEISDAALESHFEEQHLSKKRRVMESDHDLKGKGQALTTPLSIKHIHEELLLDLADEDSKVFCKDEVGVGESTVLNLELYYASEDGQDDVCSGNRLEHENPIKVGNFEEFTEVRRMHDGEGSLNAHDSVGLSQRYGIDLVGCDETMPEFEGFSIGVPSIMEDKVISSDSEIPSLTKERASLLEQLCRSRSILATESCPSSKYKIHKIPDAYHSFPAGILEQMNLSNSLHINGIDLNQLTSKDDKVTDLYCNLGSEFDASFLGSHPYKLPSSNSRYGCEARKPPLTPPVEKLQPRMISRNSVASSEELGSNPELVCFRIDENSSTTEENRHLDELETTSEEGIVSRGVQVSTDRKALADVTSVYQNVPTSVSVSKYPQRGSLDSVNTVSQLDAGPRLGYGRVSNWESEIDDKENHTLSVSGSSMQNAADSLHSRFSKPEISVKANERNRSRTTSEKWCKPNNIVSNISSFIPLVWEKQQAAAPGIGKKDIKVKALEAAETAKRLEEKRQFEREMRKAAAKLERVRLEQENVRQLELKQQQKEEARKKKEADFEARKRQREEEKKEKERKRRCTEEARKQQRVHVERLHIEKGKELQHKPANDKKRKKNELAKEAKKQSELAEGREVAKCRNTAEVEPSPSKVVYADPRHVSNCVEAFHESNCSKKAVNNSYELQNAIQDRMSVTKESQDLQSYEISPYRDSDDEDGDEDCRRKRKCIPSWARRESLDQILLSKRHIDPAEIFSRKSSFNLIEVLSSQIHWRPLS